MADGIKKVSENVIVDKRALVITDPAVSDNDAISIGALQSNPSKKGLKIKIAKNTYSYFDAKQFIMPGSITTELLADKCVTNIKLADKSVTEIKLADNSVSTRTIVNLNVTESKIANNAVTSNKIKDNSIATRHLQDKCVTNVKILDNTINNSKLLNKTITNSKIADGTVTNSLLASKCVTDIKIADDSIGTNHLKIASVYGNRIKNASITNVHLAANCVNSQNILNGAVTGVKIPSKQISGNHLMNGSVESVHVSNGAIVKDKLSTDSVSTKAIINKSVTKDKLADDVVSYIGDPVQYDSNNDVELRKDLTVKGNTEVLGSLTAKKVYNAVFMDIAEGYMPGESLEPGDVVEIREDNRVYKAELASHTIVGVVSDEYAACYGATEQELEDGIKVAVGLIGKVHVKVEGPVKIGDRIVSAGDGLAFAVSLKDFNLLSPYTIIGKVLETTDNEKALCLIYPN